MDKMKKQRVNVVIVCSFLLGYILSFVIEGRVQYSLYEHHNITANLSIILAIFAHFCGLIASGFIVKKNEMAKNYFQLAISICFVATIPFFLKPSFWWMIAMLIIGFFSGIAFASWGYLLKVSIPKKERIIACADVLILTNVIMIINNVVATLISPFVGLFLAMICLVIGFIFSGRLQDQIELERTDKSIENNKLSLDVKKPLFTLFIFVSIITINSGLMYQIINPAFEQLEILVSWYWAVPYIIALIIVRNLPSRIKRARILYAGLVMIILSFICFLVMGRDLIDYLVIDTLMLGACGIFDLFWWSIIGEMLEYTNHPIKVQGIGLSANVFGVLCGDLLSFAMARVGLSGAQVTVVALTVVCITLIILPVLNTQLTMVLKSNTYLYYYSNMEESQQIEVVQNAKTLDPLTNREKEVLEQILAGKSNADIATILCITENTVKTHVRNIYSKYDVGSRAELISMLLKNQTI